MFETVESETSEHYSHLVRVSVARPSRTLQRVLIRALLAPWASLCCPSVADLCERTFAPCANVEDSPPNIIVRAIPHFVTCAKRSRPSSFTSRNSQRCGCLLWVTIPVHGEFHSWCNLFHAGEFQPRCNSIGVIPLGGANSFRGEFPNNGCCV